MEEEIKRAGFMHEEEGDDTTTTGPCHYSLRQAALRVNLNISIDSDHTKCICCIVLVFDLSCLTLV